MNEREDSASAKTVPSCANCSTVWGKLGKTGCWGADPASAPPRPGYCPTTVHAELVTAALVHYQGDGEEARMARVAARVEGLCYARHPGSDAIHARWTRVEDTIAFAHLMKWRRIGIATCIGLLEESRRLAAILEAQGLEPASVCCKNGGTDKCVIGIAEQDKVRPNTFERPCNPS